MIIQVFWEDGNILNIERDDNFFYTSLNIKEFRKAIKNGFPAGIMRDAVCISKDLPYFIKHRLYDVKQRHYSPKDLEEKIQEKIKETGKNEISYPTDKLRIIIEI